MNGRRILLSLAVACVCFGTVGLAAQTAAKPAQWTGKLRTGVVAAGGETTGTVLTTDKGTFEIQPATDAVRAQLKKLDGQRVTVHGTLATRPGVEVRERRIITATSVAKA